MNHIKLKKRKLKSRPAIILAAFGTTSNAFRIYDEIGRAVGDLLPEERIVWAYTSEIVREKRATPGLFAAIASLESEGYRKIVVQPLHVFPATEYRVLENTCAGFSGIRIMVGETLAHRWTFIEAIFDVIASDFLPATEGLNIIAAHGSPLAAEPANIIYQGLDSYCSRRFDHVAFTTVDGMPSLAMLMRDLEQKSYLGDRRRIRIFPFLLTAGKHVMEDLLQGEESLKGRLEASGMNVDFPTLELDGEPIPKTLGAYPEIVTMYAERIHRALDLFTYY